LLATLPMLKLGYGSDVDAWLVAERALDMWTTGVYARSRSTGFPLFEIAVTPLVIAGGWIASNALALVCGVAALLLLVRLAATAALRFPVITIVSFMFLPVVVKNATSTMDYVPAMTLLIGAYVALHERRFLLSAVLIGVAVGVRPSSGLFIVPAATTAWIDTRRPRTVAAMIGLAGTIGILVFLPSLRLGSFGLAQVTSPLNGVLNGMRMFGIAQTPVVAGIVAVALWNARKRWTDAEERTFLVFHGLNALVWVALFATLPGEPEYLLPSALSVLLIIDRYATRPLALVALVVVLSFHIASLEVHGSRGGLRRRTVVLAPGFTVRDLADRRFKLWLRAAANGGVWTTPTLFMEQVKPVVVGRTEWQWVPELDLFRQKQSALAVSQVITDSEALRRIRRAGYRVVTWRAHEWEFEMPGQAGGHDLVEFVDDPSSLFKMPRRGMPFDMVADSPTSWHGTRSSRAEGALKRVDVKTSAVRAQPQP
jgi:hypothetical protein